MTADLNTEDEDRVRVRVRVVDLNHAGLCVSYTSVWKYLKQLTTEVTCVYMRII